MDAVIRALTMYAFLWVIFRFAGKRSLAEITTFDFILMLIFSEMVQQALIANDNSMTNSWILITTMMGVQILVSVIKARWPGAEKVFDGAPLVLVEDGKIHHDRLARSRLDVDDLLSAAREKQGLYELKQIRYAVLELSGGISIVPQPSD